MGDSGLATDATSVWKCARERLKDLLSTDVYERWISIIDAHAFQDQTLVLTVANDFYQFWLEENYLTLIRDAVASVSGHEYTIRFEVQQDQAAAPAAPPPVRTPEVRKVKRAEKRVRPSSSLNPNYTFDSFIIGSSNNFAHAACLAVAQSPARAYNPLFIYGGVGLGKTHLMQAIGNYVISQNNAHVTYLSSEAFTNDYIDAIQNRSLVEFRKKYRQTDLLLIDDIQFLAGKERMQEEFFHTFNALFDQHKQIVLTCDRPASEIPGLEHRLVSRFEWGLVTELETPDVETRIAILRKKQQVLNLHLPDEIIQFLAERIRANIRRLEGALIRAASYASLTGRPLTQEALEHLLRDTLDQEQQEHITIESIQRVVAEHFDIRLADMTSKRRPQSIAFPRQVAMYLSRELTQHSFPMIADAFGRNHATVLHACKLVTGKMSNDSQLRQHVMSIQQKISRRG